MIWSKRLFCALPLRELSVERSLSRFPHQVLDGMVFLPEVVVEHLDGGEVFLLQVVQLKPSVLLLKAAERECVLVGRVQDISSNH